MKQKRILPDRKELRDFGLIVGAVFLLVFGLGLPLYKRGEINPFFVGLGITLIVLGMLFPLALRWPQTAWQKLGHGLGFVNTRIILGLVFFILLTPIALIRRLQKKDPIAKKFGKHLESYKKISPEMDIRHMEKPF